MKISRIYSNLSTAFTPIDFNGVVDDQLSVVLQDNSAERQHSRQSQPGEDYTHSFDRFPAAKGCE